MPGAACRCCKVPRVAHQDDRHRLLALWLLRPVGAGAVTDAVEQDDAVHPVRQILGGLGMGRAWCWPQVRPNKLIVAEALCWRGSHLGFLETWRLGPALSPSFTCF